MSSNKILSIFSSRSAKIKLNIRLATITVTISSIQGESGVTGDGTAFFLIFKAISSGQTMLEFEPDELDFYDTSGSVINLENLDIKSTTITIN